MLIVCVGCREVREHEALGLCKRCYNRHNMRRWRKENPEKERAIARRSRARCQQQRNAYGRKWREEHRERIKASYSHWRKANPEKRAGIEARRKARKHSLPDTLTSQQAEYLLGIGQAIYPGEKLHLDHIVPLSKGGGTTLANTHAIPASLNMSKGGKLPEEAYGQLELIHA